MQTQAGSAVAVSISVNPFEPSLVDVVDNVLVVSLNPLVPTILPLVFCWVPQASPNVWL